MKLPTKKQNDKGRNARVVVPVEETFDILLRMHRIVGHKKRDAMMTECGKDYAYISTTLINSELQYNILIKLA